MFWEIAFILVLVGLIPVAFVMGRNDAEMKELKRRLDVLEGENDEIVVDPLAKAGWVDYPLEDDLVEWPEGTVDMSPQLVPKVDEIVEADLFEQINTMGLGHVDPTDATYAGETGYGDGADRVAMLGPDDEPPMYGAIEPMIDQAMYSEVEERREDVEWPDEDTFAGHGMEDLATWEDGGKLP